MVIYAFIYFHIGKSKNETHVYVYDGIFALFYAFSLLAFRNIKLALFNSRHDYQRRDQVSILF